MAAVGAVACGAGLSAVASSGSLCGGMAAVGAAARGRSGSAGDGGVVAAMCRRVAGPWVACGLVGGGVVTGAGVGGRGLWVGRL